MAVGLLVLIAGTSFVVISTSFREALAGNEQVRARQILSEGLAAVRHMRNRDFTLLEAGTHGLALSGTDWAFSGGSDVTDGTYARTVTVAKIDANQDDITVNVAWQPLPGRTASLSASTRLTNWLAAPIPSGSHCSTASAAGDWSHPTAAGSIDIGPGNEGTSVAVKGSDVFVSGEASSAAKPDLFVFDATNPASIKPLASVDIGSGGISSLFLLGNDLYAASPNDGKEFMAFDVTDPAAPVLLGSVDLPGAAAGLSVLADAHWAVVGRASGSSANVVFFDVTDPAHPSVTASFTEAGDINDFATDGRYVYAVSTSDKSNVIVYDLSNPDAPARVTSFSLPSGSENISAAYEAPDTLFVGNTANQLAVLDVADPRHPSVVSTYDVGGQVEKVSCVTGSLGFVASTNSNAEFSILDISHLASIQPYASFNFPEVATDAVFSDDRVYISVRSNDALRIITPGP